MARAIAAGVAAGAAVAACFSAPSRPGGAPDDSAVSDVIRIDSLSTDAHPIDSAEADAMPGCTSEAFATSGGCGLLGTGSGFGSSAIFRANSQLYLSLMGSGTGSASCRTAPTNINSVTFDLQGVAVGSNGMSTFVGFVSNTGNRYGVELVWVNAGSYIGIQPVCSTAVAVAPLTEWDPVQYHFVRLEKNTGANTTDITLGPVPSGGTTEIYQCSGTTQMATAEMTAVAFRSGSAGGGSARIETFEHCP